MKRFPYARVCTTLLIALLLVLPAAVLCAQTRSSTPASASGVTGAGKAIGSKSAPITIEVFSDFQCPACRSFYENSVKQLLDNYVYTGKVYLVHRDFPLDMHPHARQAARLANAAAELGQFEAVERALFDTQDTWTGSGRIDEAISRVLSPADLKRIHDFEAQNLSAINASIEKDRNMGIQRGVNQTPSVYVTARGKTEALPGGAIDYRLLKQYLDYLLRQ